MRIFLDAKINFASKTHPVQPLISLVFILIINFCIQLAPVFLTLYLSEMRFPTPPIYGRGLGTLSKVDVLNLHPGLI